MCRLWPPDDLAQALGTHLGRGEVLLRRLPPGPHYCGPGRKELTRVLGAPSRPRGLRIYCGPGRKELTRVASLRTLVIVLGDQLDLEAAAFDGFDPAQDAVWMTYSISIS